ncbi:hypothetical protein PY365_04360 [Roseiarcaceae bacterium H3SJ34-1]|uniref:hypothetical protein n=1 Tax=Terripilifer ovatus TaxID=3032367 RepID=UPI003AB93CE8|nr:hypothetical protein [Roseiarcaceae bacterium H3SJ34-1]
MPGPVVIAVEGVAALLSAVGAINDIVELIIKLADSPAVKSALGLARAGAAGSKTGIDYARQVTGQRRTAAGLGTTTQNVDALSRTYEGLGQSSEDATRDIMRFAAELDSAFSKTDKALPWVEALGVESEDKNGNRLDTGEVYQNVLKALADKGKSIQDRQEEFTAVRQAGGTVKPEDQAKLIADQKVFNAASSEFFKDNTKLFGALKLIGGSANLKQLTDDGLARHPSLSPQDYSAYERAEKKETENDQSRRRLNDIENKNFLPDIVAAAKRGSEEVGVKIEDAIRTGEALNKKRLEQWNIKEAKRGIREQSPIEERTRRRIPEARDTPFWSNAYKAAQDFIAQAGLVDKARSQAAKAIGVASPEIQTRLTVKYYDELRKLFDAEYSFLKMQRTDVKGRPEQRSDNSDASNRSQTYAFNIDITAGASASEIASAVRGSVQTAVAMLKGTNGWTQGAAIG